MLKIKGISEICLVEKCGECKDGLTLNKHQQEHKDKLWNLLFESTPTPVKENIQFEQTKYKVHTFTLAVILKNMEELAYRNGINELLGISIDKVITEIIENNTLKNDYHTFAINSIKKMDLIPSPDNEDGTAVTIEWTVTGVDTQDLWEKSNYKYFNEVAPLLINATPIWCFGNDYLDEIKKDIKHTRVNYFVQRLNPIFYRYHLSEFEDNIDQSIAELKKYHCEK